MSDAPLLSILMVTHGAWAWTERALTAVHEHTQVPYEVIVVDNASPDGTPAKLAQRFRGVRLIEQGENIGFGPANNLAAEQARGSTLALLNTDAIVGPGWHDPLLRALDLPGVGAVVPALLNDDGTLQGTGAVLGRDGSVVSLGTDSSPDDPAFRFGRTVDFGAAACMLVETSTFRDAGGFDDRYAVAYFEDLDLCLALERRGLRTRYVPQTRVLHGLYGSGSHERAAELFERNRSEFLAKWRDDLVDHVPTVWPPHPARLLAARDRSAAGRALVLDDADEATRLAARNPHARVTLLTEHAGERLDELCDAGVEVCEPANAAAWSASRRLHYDVVVAGDATARLLDAVRNSQPLAAVVERSAATTLV